MKCCTKIVAKTINGIAFKISDIWKRNTARALLSKIVNKIALSVKVGDEEARIAAVQPAAAENHPAAVGRPAVVALCIGAVERLRRSDAAVFQIEIY